MATTWDVGRRHDCAGGTQPPAQSSCDEEDFVTQPNPAALPMAQWACLGRALLDLDRTANALKRVLGSVRLILVHALEDGLGCLVDQCLGLLQTQAGQ